MTPSVDWAAAGYGVAGGDQPKHILNAVTDLMLDTGTDTRWVFRGAGDSTWPLWSTLYRQLADTLGRSPAEAEVRISEQHLLKRGRDWQLDLNEAGSIPDMHLLARMQHHGTPTRLLDVTCNPMTALWFACSSHFDREGVLFLLNVTDLPTYRSIDWEGVANSWGSLEDPLGYPWTNALDISNSEQRSFLVSPTIRDQRMTVQEGLFLSSCVPDETGEADPIRGLWPPSEQHQMVQRMVWNMDSLGILDASGQIQNKLSGLTVIALLIPAKIKPELLTMLDVTYNRRWETVFPDISGFSAAVRDGTVPIVPH